MEGMADTKFQKKTRFSPRHFTKSVLCFVRWPCDKGISQCFSFHFMTFLCCGSLWYMGARIFSNRKLFLRFWSELTFWLCEHEYVGLCLFPFEYVGQVLKADITIGYDRVDSVQNQVCSICYTHNVIRYK